MAPSCQRYLRIRAYSVADKDVRQPTLIPYFPVKDCQVFGSRRRRAVRRCLSIHRKIDFNPQRRIARNNHVAL